MARNQFKPTAANRVRHSLTYGAILLAEHLAKPGGPILFESVPAPRSPNHLFLSTYTECSGYLYIHFFAAPAAIVSAAASRSRLSAASTSISPEPGCVAEFVTS